MWAYILIVLTGLTAILSNFVDIEETKKGLRFLKLNWVRILVSILFLLLMAFSITNQLSETDEKYEATKKLKEKELKDSLIAVARFASIDSSHKETITNFIIQRKIDSILLSKDSMNFLQTFKKFEEQLMSQKKAITGIENVQNPMFPMNLIVKFEFDLDSLPANDKTTFEKILASLYKINVYQKDTLIFPQEFGMQKDKKEVSFLRGKHLNPGNDPYNPAYYNEYYDIDFFIDRLNPGYLDINFFKSPFSNPYVSELSIDITNFEYSYIYSKELNSITVTWNETINPVDLRSRNINNFRQVAGDSLLISVNVRNEYTNLNFLQLTFNLGDNYFNSYNIYPSIEMALKKNPFSEGFSELVFAAKVN